MSPSYRLLFLDLDGTLVYRDDIVTARTLDALHAARKRGCTVVLCTGRSRYRTQDVAAQVGGHGYGIVLNGGVVFDWQEAEVLHKITLPAETAREAVRRMHHLEMAPLCFAVEDDDRWVHTDTRLPVLPEYVDFARDRLVYCDDLDACAPPVSIETYGTLMQAEALLEAWRRAFGETVKAFRWDAGYFRAGLWGLHIHAGAVHKAFGAQIVAERLGVPRAQTLAIGDEVNDRELLEWAGWGVAMGNGHPDCRAAADHITGTIQEDGVAQAIEQFVLRCDA